jgi:methylated-DNA-[protein]-cysteine S-methyltransferase
MPETAKSGISAIGFDSPIGPLAVHERAGTIVAVSWSIPKKETDSPILAAAKAQLDGYFFCGLRRFELPLAPEGSEFDRKVWQAMLEIPYGQTRSYGEIAEAIGGNARDVGGACGRNPIPIFIPCHRVMGAGGTLVGYSGGKGTETKQALLVLEGVLLL